MDRDPLDRASPDRTPPERAAPDVEPSFAPWRTMHVVDAVERVARMARTRSRRALRTIAVDGRSGAGKTRFAATLAACLPNACTVHTDDAAWHHSFFDWHGPLADRVLAPARAGRAVRWRPDAWVERGREGAIEVPEGTVWLVVEGVGAARRELLAHVDAVVWVACDRAEARERGIARDGGTPGAAAFWDEWEAAEVPFLSEQRPWERADLVVCGTPAERVPDRHVRVSDRR